RGGGEERAVMSGRFFSQGEVEDLKSRNPVDQVAGKWVRLRHAGPTKMIGPCPICSPDPNSADATRFEATADSWVCAVCCDGGDVIRLVERVQNLDFVDAVAWLGGTRRIDPEEERRREEARARQRAARERENQHYRERERRTLFDIWRNAHDLPATPAET